jgi:muramoyltetrapeptide carboxypeptidase
MSTEPLSLLKPPAVPAGASVSVVAPASFAQPDRVERGLEVLRIFGFAPRVGTSAQTRGPLYFAGTPEQRLPICTRPLPTKVQAPSCFLRGGYGSNYLLDGLDLKLIASHPKPFFAYSDLTGIQLRLLDQIGLPAFHGPMVAADFYLEDGVHLPSFHAALAGRPYRVGAAEGMRALKPGRARGTLYGGCLSILVSLLGTRFEPHTEGKLLFLEDTGAKPYQWTACCGNCARPANSTACAASSLAKCSIALRPAPSLNFWRKQS